MSTFLDMAEEELEAILAPLTVLHLRGIFPRWDSLAYYNLVDLRLTSAFRYSWCSIKEANLMSVLRASPELRILHFALAIKSRSPEVAPVVLKDLEVINIKTVCRYAKPLEVGSVLRLLAPGTRPLRLTLENEVYEEGPSMDEIMRFFERANISRFCAKEGYPPIKTLLPRTPNLQHLVFSSCKHFSRENLYLSVEYGDTPELLAPAQSSWHVRESQLDLDDMESFIDIYHARSLVLSNCYIFEVGEQEPLAESELFEFTQSVCFKSYQGLSPDPTVDWDILD
ncbi:hypothetical protein FRC11_009610 [Ceratobasidium sp. 423]|nr:hypothetical protein FRC11_009610 [Ceratobasidium sp. 423]